MTILLCLLLALAVAAIATTVRAIWLDGYRRHPTR